MNRPIIKFKTFHLSEIFEQWQIDNHFVKILSVSPLMSGNLVNGNTIETIPITTDTSMTTSFMPPDIFVLYTDSTDIDEVIDDV